MVYDASTESDLGVEQSLFARSSAGQIISAVHELVESEIPPVGAGRTAERWLALYRWARDGSVSVARLAEAHLDAHAILDEAGLSPASKNELYGVWASGPASTARLDAEAQRVHGTKQFCSGVGLVSRALVIVESTVGPAQLVEVDTTALAPPEMWATVALRDTLTGPVDLTSCPVIRTIESAKWYLDRPGFWHGAVGPAACWAGAAAGLAQIVTERGTDDPHRLIAQGELLALEFALEALLTYAGDGTDADPDDSTSAQRRARSCRRAVERTTAQISDVFSQTVGPRPFVTDAAIAQRWADLHLYARQHHGSADLEALGHLGPS